MRLSSYSFEKLVVELLSKMMYGTVTYENHVTFVSRNDGIDGAVMEDKLGFNLVYMHIKKGVEGQVVGHSEIQNFVGAIAGKHGNGLFVTTVKFSRQAKEYVSSNHIILIDGKKLADLMIKYSSVYLSANHLKSKLLI